MFHNCPIYVQSHLLLFMYSGSGPNALTLSDFIQMIWDQKPPVVVMLTRLFEKGKVAMYPIFLAPQCQLLYMQV